MKVIVRCANNRVTKAEMEQIIESLFQENKDLRVHIGHLRDELNLAQQQSETRRQKMVEKDKEIDRMRATIANVGADRDNFEASYKQVLQWWETAQSKAVKAEAIADEYRIALMESDCRVNELEKQLEWVRNKNDEWATVAQGLRNTIEEMKAQKEADDKKCEETCTACNELYEDVLSDRNHLREEVARLTNERDTAVHENTEMMFYIDDLQEDNKELEVKFSELEQVHKLWGEEIDRLRRTVTELQTNRFTTDEFINMIMKNFVPSTDKLDF